MLSVAIEEIILSATLLRVITVNVMAPENISLKISVTAALATALKQICAPGPIL
jgi:hypothetical protein